MRPPLIYFAEGALPQKLVPHINSDGQICTLPDGVSVNPEKPEEQTDEILKRAEMLLVKPYSESDLNAAVEDELCAYWTLSNNPVVFLEDNTLETHSPVRLMQRAFPAKKDAFLVQAIPEHIANDVDVGVSVDIYPRDFASLCCRSGHEFISSQSQVSLALENLIALANSRGRSLKRCRLFVFFRCHTSKGIVWLAGIVKETLSLKPKHRDSFVSSTLSLIRNGGFTRCGIEDLRTKRLVLRAVGQSETIGLSDFKVAFVGCGSVGSTVAELIICSGVTNSMFIDHDKFEPANLARHTLDHPYLYQPKAAGMKIKLHQRFPEVIVRDINGDVRTPRVLKQLQDFAPSLTIVATGDTNTDLFLASHCRSGAIGNLVFLWVESHLEAGHAVFQASEHNASLLDLHPGPTGQYKFQVSRTVATERERGCNTNYTPYSAVDLHVFVAMAAKQIVNWLQYCPKTLTALRWAPSSSTFEFVWPK
jgi:hypothetical protein